MDMLAKLLQERLGLSEDMAQQASSVCLEFFKDKLPDSLAKQLDGFIAGEDSMLDGIVPDSISNMAAGFFGGGNDS